MHKKHRIKPLLQKFILGRCTPEETEKVVAYFKAASDTDQMPSVEEVQELLKDTAKMEAKVANKIYYQIVDSHTSKGQAPMRQAFPTRVLWRYAAALLVGAAAIGGYFYHQNTFQGHQTAQIVPTEQYVTLQFENEPARKVMLTDTTALHDSAGRVVGYQKGKQIVYTDDTAAAVGNHVLNVPYGKQIAVQLSDGTHIHLNAGSTLRYPTGFANHERRSVALSGEAYFDVAKDPARPFVVNVNTLDVAVLGTRFNVSAYPEDPSNDVVLVEGAVSLRYNMDTARRTPGTVLAPGSKGIFDKNTGGITVKPVSANLYIAWVTGELVFRNMAFDNILKKLARHYNVSITNNNSALGKEEFNASFGNAPIEKVLQNLKTAYGIDYEITNNKVYIQ